MSYAVQEFMRQDAAPLEGVFVEWRLRWRLTPGRLELDKEPADLTEPQLAGLRMSTKDMMRTNAAKARAARHP
jgi:hypothetical protein